MMILIILTGILLLRRHPHTFKEFEVPPGFEIGKDDFRPLPVPKFF